MALTSYGFQRYKDLLRLIREAKKKYQTKFPDYSEEEIALIPEVNSLMAEMYRLRQGMQTPAPTTLGLPRQSPGQTIM